MGSPTLRVSRDEPPPPQLAGSARTPASDRRSPLRRRRRGEARPPFFRRRSRPSPCRSSRPADGWARSAVMLAAPTAIPPQPRFRRRGGSRCSAAGPEARRRSIRRRRRSPPSRAGQRVSAPAHLQRLVGKSRLIVSHGLRSPDGCARRPYPEGDLRKAPAPGPCPWSSSPAASPVSRPAVSQHLRVLKEAGLVRDRPVGTRRIYEVDPEGFGQMRTWFEDFWTDALDAFKRAAEAERSDR